MLEMTLTSLFRKYRILTSSYEKGREPEITVIQQLTIGSKMLNGFHIVILPRRNYHINVYLLVIVYTV